MSRRRQPTFRIVGYDKLADDWELARNIFYDFFPCEKDDFRECMVCPHWTSCAKEIAGIRDYLTIDRQKERQDTGNILLKLTNMIREMKGKIMGASIIHFRADEESPEGLLEGEIYLNIFKVRPEDSDCYLMSWNNFTTKTGMIPPYCQEKDGEVKYYAICPACDNPIELFGLMPRRGVYLPPYGVHVKHVVKDLAKFTKKAFSVCPFREEKVSQKIIIIRR